MFEYRLKNTAIIYDGNIFTVICEDGDCRTANAAEARELFLGEIDRKFRRFINGKLRDDGFNVHTGKRV